MTNTDARIAIATAEILARHGTPEGEMNVDLFVSHHKEELSSNEWETCLGNAKPSDIEMPLKSLVLMDSGIPKAMEQSKTYDFSLPNGLTNYMISVRFVGDTVESVDMES